MQCATHPNVETDLRCSRCEKPICPRCMVQTPVGARCRECANVRRLPTYNVSRGIFARAVGAALLSGVALGAAWSFFNLLSFFFFGIFVGLAVGYCVGQSVSWAAGRRSGPPLQAAAVGGTVVAYVVRMGLLFAFGAWGVSDLRTDVFGLIALVIAAFIAASRLR